MPKYQTKEKIKSVEINVEPFDEIMFFILPDIQSKGKYRVDVRCIISGGMETIEGKSEPFTFSSNSVIHSYCKEAYANLIKNIEKFVEENA